ncbi:MAG: hypothetical protein LBQ43_00830 [Holosporales bacterium]|jgi:hypothetical protein|nr:hypothetical protein [Holosporales bacterium]
MLFRRRRDLCGARLIGAKVRLRYGGDDRQHLIIQFGRAFIRYYSMNSLYTAKNAIIRFGCMSNTFV